MFMAAQGEDKPEVLAFIDDPTAPEIYADETAGFALLHGTVAITLEAVRWDHGANSSPPRRVVVARLRMSVIGAQNLATGLFDFLTQRGLDPARKSLDDKVQ